MDKEEERRYWARVVHEVLRMSGWTMQQLADYLGVDPRNVRYWRSGQKCPNGIVTVRLYEYRVSLHNGTVVPCETTGASIT